MDTDEIFTVLVRSISKVFDLNRPPRETDSLANDLFAEPVDLKDLCRVLAEDYRILLDEIRLIAMLNNNPDLLTVGYLRKEIVQIRLKTTI